MSEHCGCLGTINDSVACRYPALQKDHAAALEAIRRLRSAIQFWAADTKTTVEFANVLVETERYEVKR